MSKIALLKDTPLIQVIDQPIYPLEKQRLGKAKGLIIGGLLTGILILIILTLKKIYKDIIND